MYVYMMYFMYVNMLCMYVCVYNVCMYLCGVGGPGTNAIGMGFERMFTATSRGKFRCT